MFERKRIVPTSRRSAVLHLSCPRDHADRDQHQSGKNQNRRTQYRCRLDEQKKSQTRKQSDQRHDARDFETSDSLSLARFDDQQ